MANRQIIYDFETVLKTLIESNQDIISILTLWHEMLDPAPRMVRFPMHDGTYLETPNISMIVSTINQRTLPPSPNFKKVNVSTPNAGGGATLMPGGLLFAGPGIEAHYDSNGISGQALVLEGVSSSHQVDTIREWPLRRYWKGKEGATQYSVVVVPAGWADDQAVPNGCDFFVWLPAGSTMTIAFTNPGAPQRLTLDAGASAGIWHVAAYIWHETGGSRMFARASRMEV